MCSLQMAAWQPTETVQEAEHRLGYRVVDHISLNHLPADEGNVFDDGIELRRAVSPDMARQRAL